MIIPPPYLITPEMLELISKIDSNKQLLQSLNPKPEIISKIQRISLLKSSLYSARIEGNSLSWQNVEKSEDNKDKKEVINIFQAIQYINKRLNKQSKLTAEIILSLHQKIMDQLSPEEGYFRREMSAIFNQAGVAVYLPPPPNKVNGLINQLINFINSNDEKFTIITALIGHLVFEKVHPFMDGNGRVGRLLVSTILLIKGSDFNINIPFEEYIDQHKEDYYYYLDVGMREPSAYLLFMLKAFNESEELMKQNVINEINQNNKTYLPPRQEELFLIIKEHRTVSFDFLHRRFLQIPKRTLRYDLQQLAKQNLIIKIGKTRGSFYTEK